MVSNLSELALKQVEVGDWVLLSIQVEIIPELSDLFVKETNGTLVSPRCKWTEDEIVSTDTLWLETESTVTNKTLTVVEYLKSNWLGQWVAEGDQEEKMQ